MTSSEKRKLKSTRNQGRDPVARLTEEQLLKLQQASGQTGNEYLASTQFENSAGQSRTEDSGITPLISRPADLKSDSVFSFYPSGAPTSESDRPTLVDAVIEQLRLARLRRQRPH